MTRRARLFASLSLLLVVTAVSAPSLEAQRVRSGGRVSYLIDYLPGRNPAFEITINVSGLKRSDQLSFEMSDWGEWQGREADLRVVESEPQLLVNDRKGRYFVPDLRSTGASDARFVYRLKLGAPGSLRPAQADGYGFAWLENTLLDVRLGGESLPGNRMLTVNAPEEWPFANGWAGAAMGSQDAYMPAPMQNAPLAVGEPAAEHRRSFGGLDVEVFQYGQGPDITETVAEVVGRCGPDLAVSFGRPLRTPYRAFVTDHQGGSMGSAYGLRVSSRAEHPESYAESPGLRVEVTRRLIDEWMSQALPSGDPSLGWLEEGLAGYLALWQCASTGIISQDDFARRMLEVEAMGQRSPAWGEVALGDADVDWRDGDGPHATLASAGGAVMFLAMDAALRAADEPGLPALMQHLLARTDRDETAAAVRAWALEHELRTLYTSAVEGADMPAVAESLASLGFREVEGASDLDRFTSEGADVRLAASFRFRLPNSARR